MGVPKDPEKYEVWRSKISETCKIPHPGMGYPRRGTPEYEEWIKTPEYVEHCRLSSERKGELNPCYGKPSPNKGGTHTEATRKKLSDAWDYDKHFPPRTKDKISIACAGEKNGFYGKKHTKESISKISEDAKKRIGCMNPMYGRDRTEEPREWLVGGHWYGNIKYSEDREYCERWTPDLRNRIRAYWGNVSAYSGLTQEQNYNGELLSCHHVYYQKKACCTWDEDAQGYYAMIDGERYYIKGDPNKFVPLTRGENAMVNFDKLKWVKFFEDLIGKRGGKCYYTQEEIP